MTPDWVVFLVGLFVTTMYGTIVGVLLYAAGKSGNRSDEGNGVEPVSDYKGPNLRGMSSHQRKGDGSP